MRLQAEDVVTVGYLGCVALLVAIFHERVEGAWFHLTIHILWIASVLALVWAAGRRPTRPFLHLRTWYHILSIPLAFRELHYLVHPINPQDIDPILVRWDWQIFSVHPTVWLERFMSPLLTEYLQLVYTTFYFLPLVLGFLLWRDKHWQGIRASLVGVVTAFYLSYLGYFAFPALGPRFEIGHLQTKPLEGLWLTHHIREILDSLELVQRDAFPSGHVGVSVLVLYYAWKYCRRAFPGYLLIVSSMVMSTVYLRYHYVVDVLAGFLLSIVSGWVASRLRTFFPNEVHPWSTNGHIQTKA